MGLTVCRGFWKRFWPVLPVAILFLCSMWNWKKENIYQQSAAVQVDFAMNTVVEYCLYGEEDAQALEQCRQKVSELEHILSATWQGSDLERLADGAGTPVSVSQDTLSVLEQAVRLYEWTGGRFDVTVGPLVQLWGITSTSPRVPSQQQIDEILPLVGEQPKMDAQAGTAWISQGQQLDFGGIAKGYTCDRLREICDRYGVQEGYISLGGNMMVLEDTTSLFGIRDPLGGEQAYFASLSLAGTTMATAGGYERYFEQDGKRYCHILDPETGWPAQTDLLSVSVLSQDGALADALSTALYLMGREEAMAFLQDCSQVQAVLVDTDRTVWVYGEIPDFSLHDGAGYRLAS